MLHYHTNFATNYATNFVYNFWHFIPEIYYGFEKGQVDNLVTEELIGKSLAKKALVKISEE